MANDYLTKPQREDFLIWYQGVLDAEEMLTKWTGNALTANEHKWLKTAVTLNQKVFKSILGRIKPQQVVTIENQTGEMQRRLNRAKQKEDTIEFDRQSFLRLCEGVTIACCSPCACDHDHKCPWRYTFGLVQMPRYDSKATGKGQCPYEHYTEQHLTRFSLPCQVGDKVYQAGMDRPCGYVESLHQDKSGWSVHIKGALEGWFDPKEIGRSLFLTPTKEEKK